jgi:Flp pilus assembly pilin Flp
LLHVMVWFEALIGSACSAVVRLIERTLATHPRTGAREEGQTTAEYALVILAAAAIAVVLIVWARSSGKLPAFFDKIIDSITNNAR